MSIQAAEWIILATACLLAAPAATAPLPHAGGTSAESSETAAINWADCTACHAELVSHSPKLSELRPAGLGSTLETNCAACHPAAELLIFPNSWSHPVRTVGEHVNCLACHPGGPHNAERRPKLPTGDYDAKGCFTCHPEVQLDFGASTGHDDHPAIRCKDCHPPHTEMQAGLVADLLPPGSRALWEGSYDWRVSNKLCLRCHPAGGLFFTVNQGGFITLNAQNYHETHVINGQVLCIECHNPHGGSRAAFIRSKLITGEVLSYYPEMDGGTCAVACHSVQHDYWKYTNRVF